MESNDADNELDPKPKMYEAKVLPRPGHWTSEDPLMYYEQTHVIRDVAALSEAAKDWLEQDMQARFQFVLGSQLLDRLQDGNWYVVRMAPIQQKHMSSEYMGSGYLMQYSRRVYMQAVRPARDLRIYGETNA